MFEKLSEKFGKAPSAADYEGKKWNRRSERFLEMQEKHLEKKGKQLSGKNKKKRVLLIAAGVGSPLRPAVCFWHSPQRKGENGQRKSWRAEDSCRYSGNP